MAGDTETQDREDRTWREVRHYAYVDRPFAEVGQLLANAPERVVGHPGDAAATRERLSDLHVWRAGIDMSRDVQITIGDIVLDEDAARLGLRWEDARRPKLFPVLEAALELAPLTAGRHDITQVGLVGRYRPPFGRLGTVADTLAGRRVVMESIERWGGQVEKGTDDRVDGAEWPWPPAPRAPHGGGMQKMLLILNDPPYGTERSFNGLRLAGALARRDGTEVRVFLIGDAVGCAMSNQVVPNGYYHLDRMIESAARHGADVGCCGTCLDARGIPEELLTKGARRSSLDELADWSLWADTVVTF